MAVTIYTSKLLLPYACAHIRAFVHFAAFASSYSCFLALILHFHHNPSKFSCLFSFSFISLNLRVDDLVLFSLQFFLGLVFLG